MMISKAYAQEEKICGKIEYIQSTHFSRDFSKDFSLKFNNYNSIYKEENILNKKEKIKQTNNDKGRQFDIDISRNNLNPEFFYNDRISFHYMEIWFDKELLVKEDNIIWKWSLKNEMNKTTVYRILDRLEQEGIIHSFNGKDGLKWYAKCEGCHAQHHLDKHPHFQCTECGIVDCLEINVTIPNIPNRRIDNSQVLILGQCDLCIH